ncbi:MKL/myocardin-like protein 1 [Nymphon striatum]|nr:MKL/myocardin-like protein 1 [Nymphon striatum]
MADGPRKPHSEYHPVANGEEGSLKMGDLTWGSLLLFDRDEWTCVINLKLVGASQPTPETGDSQIYWGIQLDQDLLETLIAFYPNWFNGYNLNLPNMTDNNNGLYQLSTPSPPKSEVDENSLQKSMDKNKESLKTPPAFHEQRQKLERAKTGDLLRNKIQRRPARQQLIQQHILEDTTVDPSLQERQRLLKKARLQDDLNDRLSHRPGPLELIKGNILKTDEPLAQAIKGIFIELLMASKLNHR